MAMIPVVVLYAVFAVIAATSAETFQKEEKLEESILQRPQGNLSINSDTVPTEVEEAPTDSSSITDAETTISILLKQMHSRKRVVLKELAQPQGCQEFVERVYWTCEMDRLNELVIYKVLISVNALQDLYCEEMSSTLKAVILAQSQEIFKEDMTTPTLILENDQAPKSTKAFCDVDFAIFGQCDFFKDWRVKAICRFYASNHVGFMFSLSDAVNGATKQATSIISSKVKKAIKTLNKAVEKGVKQVQNTPVLVKDSVVKLAEDTKAGAETAIKAGAGAVKEAANAVGSKVKTAVNGAVDGAVSSMKEEFDRIVEVYKLKWVAAALAVVLLGLILYWAYPFISACFAFLKCGWKCFTCVLPKVMWLIECCIERRRKSKEAAEDLNRRDFEVEFIEEDLYDQVASDEMDDVEEDEEPGVWTRTLEFLTLKRSRRHGEYIRSPSSNVETENEAPSMRPRTSWANEDLRQPFPTARNSADFGQLHRQASPFQRRPSLGNSRE